MSSKLCVSQGRLQEFSLAVTKTLRNFLYTKLCKINILILVANLLAYVILFCWAILSTYSEIFFIYFGDVEKIKLHLKITQKSGTFFWNPVRIEWSHPWCIPIVGYIHNHQLDCVNFIRISRAWKTRYWVILDIIYTSSCVENLCAYQSCCWKSTCSLLEIFTNSTVNCAWPFKELIRNFNHCISPPWIPCCF